MPASPDRRLSVVQLLPDLEAGGVERGTLETAAALVDAGHRSVVVSAGGRLVPELTGGGSEHVTLPVGRKSPATLRLVARLRPLFADADIVHARSRVPAWLTLLTCRSLPAARRPRFLTTMHGLHSVGRFSRIMTQGEQVVAVSGTVRDHIATCYGRTAGVRVVRNGIDHSRYSPDFRPSRAWREQLATDYPATRGRKLVTLTGRLTRLKGHYDLLDVMRRLPSDWHALIVGGDDPRRQAYADTLRAAAAGLPVSFLGHRTDVRELASVSTAVVSLSTKPESFGRTVLEALALGTPVVGYSHGGVGEVLGELFPGGRVAVGDVVGVAERLQTIAQRGERPQPFASFDLRDTCEQMIGVYESLAGVTRRAVPITKAAA